MKWNKSGYEESPRTEYRGKWQKTELKALRDKLDNVVSYHDQVLTEYPVLREQLDNIIAEISRKSS